MNPVMKFVDKKTYDRENVQVIIRSRKKVTKGLESKDATVKLTSLKIDDHLEKQERLIRD